MQLEKQQQLKSQIDSIFEFAISNIAGGVEKSLNLAKNWAYVLMGKNDIPSAVDESFDLAKHWTFFGINFVVKIVEEATKVANVNVINKKGL